MSSTAINAQGLNVSRQGAAQVCDYRAVILLLVPSFEPTPPGRLVMPSQLKERAPFIERQKDLEIQGFRKMVETLLVQSELSRMFLGCLGFKPG